MQKCEFCGKTFSAEEAEREFADEYIMPYSNFRKTLCGKCAISAMDNYEKGVYFMNCESCGKLFDLNYDEEKCVDILLEKEEYDLINFWTTRNICLNCLFLFRKNMNNFSNKNGESKN